MKQSAIPHYVIVGLGLSGRSVVRYFQQQGIAFDLADTRQTLNDLAELNALFPEANILLAPDDQALVAYPCVVLSPGLSRLLPLVENARLAGAEIIGDVELFARAVQKPYVAITGSNGKSTVTRLVEAMLLADEKKGLAAGNIGLPILDALAENAASYVLELSSFQLETTASLDAVAAVILNIEEDHMDRYSGMDDYAAAKARIYAQTQLKVINLDDERVSAFATGDNAEKTFSLQLNHTTANYGLLEKMGRIYLHRDQASLIDVEEVALLGKHNLANVLAAWALADALQVSDSAKVKAVKAFKGLAHRVQNVRKRDQVVWVNDSKATNVGATCAALKGFDQPVILIAGGLDKDADFAPLREIVAEKVKHVLLMGQDAAKLAKALAIPNKTSFVDSLQDAVMQANVLAEPGDVVLLSPACASFDMFSGFEDRGEQFIAAVDRLS